MFDVVEHEQGVSPSVEGTSKVKRIRDFVPNKRNVERSRYGFEDTFRGRGFCEIGQTDTRRDRMLRPRVRPNPLQREAGLPDPGRAEDGHESVTCKKCAERLKLL
jgi:hypothetical protein